MRANEEAAQSQCIHSDAKPQQILLEEIKRAGRHLKAIYRHCTPEDMEEEVYLYQLRTK